MMVVAKKGEKVFCPICGEYIAGGPQEQKAKKILYWTDPMIPGYKAGGPGKSPMGMDLVPVYEQGSSMGQAAAVPGYTMVSLTPQKQQLIGVKTAMVEKKNAVKTIRASGRVATNNELYTLQDEYVKAYTNFVTTYRESQRYEHLRRNWEPHREIQVKLHEAEDKLLRLGLGMDQIEKLQKVSWTTPWNQPSLLFLYDHFEYWVTAQIFEEDLGYVEVGEEADIDIPAYRETAKGVIRSIGGIVNPETRTVNALIELKDYHGELKTNMFVNVSLHAPLMDVIIVPRDAVMDTGTRKIAFVQKDDGTFEPRVLETGWTTDDGFEIKSGLKAGERIITSGNFLIDSESRLKAAMEGVTTSGGQDEK